MFKLGEIRDLNQVKLLYTDKKEFTDLIFKAYLKEGYNFRMGIKVGDAFGSFKGVTEDPLVASLMQTIIASTGRKETAVLNVPRKMTFTGGEWTSFSIPCTLYVVEDFNTDIYTPIKNLESYLLPKDSEDFNTDEVFAKANEWLAERKESAIKKHKAKNPEYSGGIWELAQKGTKMLQEYIGNISVMEVPGQFADSSKSITLLLPGLTVPDVFIQSIDFRIPYVKYAKETGDPFIDRVDLTLNFETMRVVSRGYMSFLK